MPFLFRLPENIQKEGIITAIHAYRYNKMKTLLANIMVVLTFGIVYLFMNWSLQLWLFMKCDETDQISMADFCVVRTQDNKNNIGKLEQKQFKINDDKKFYTILNFRFYRYYYRSEEQEFQILQPNYDQLTYKDIVHEILNSHTQDMEEVREKYGDNNTKIPKKTNKQILFEEIITPFYLFQLFSCLLWYFTDYGTYATFIAFTSAISIGEALYDYKQQYKKMRNLSKNQGTIQIYKQQLFKNNQLEFNDQMITPDEISTKDLLPGQLIHITNGLVLPCDAILVKGQCVMNEAILTGESLPILKSSIPTYSDSTLQVDGKKHTLYSGTKCLEIKTNSHYPTIAMVTSTGFNTVKGSLIRSIMFTIESYLQFYKDAFKFIAVLAFMTVIGFFISLPAKLKFIKQLEDEDYSLIILDTLDLLTITVPPALPTTLQVGLTIALHRLKKKKIFCIAPQKINSAGKVNLMCFDKTGTLTEEGLEMHEVKQVIDGEFSALDVDQSAPIFEVLACCHSLINLQDKVIGDYLDLKMFEFTKCKMRDLDDKVQIYLDQPELINGFNRQIIKRFDFDSKLQRMGVVIKASNSDEEKLLVKGAPEKIKQLCSRVPHNFNYVLNEYLRQGYRVLGCGSKIYEGDHNFDGLEFLGFIFMENKLKNMSLPVIKELKFANIQSIMITGDNILTSINVAKQCQIIGLDKDIYYSEVVDNRVEWINFETSEQNKEIMISNESQQLVKSENDYVLGITGQAYKILEQQSSRLLHKCVVYARMSPDDKTQIIQSYQQQNYVVGFCGDGANDCGALKTAHIGISLSEAEASVAAPFTSSVADISCVPHLLYEGRSGLRTTFNCFKFMMLYSVIQFTSVTILYFDYAYFSNYQFLYIDLLVIIPLGFTMSLMKSRKKLTKKSPNDSLFKELPSFLGLSVIQIVFQIIIYVILKYQSWYVEAGELSDYEDEIDGFPDSYERTTIFLFCNFQYLFTVLAFTGGKPFQQRFYSNFWFSLMLVIILMLNLSMLIFYQSFPVDMQLTMDGMPGAWITIMSLLCILNSGLTLIYEKYIITRFS